MKKLIITIVTVLSAFSSVFAQEQTPKPVEFININLDTENGLSTTSRVEIDPKTIQLLTCDEGPALDKAFENAKWPSRSMSSTWSGHYDGILRFGEYLLQVQDDEELMRVVHFLRRRVDMSKPLVVILRDAADVEVQVSSYDPTRVQWTKKSRIVDFVGLKKVDGD